MKTDLSKNPRDFGCGLPLVPVYWDSLTPAKRLNMSAACKPCPETWSAQFRLKLELAKGFEPPTL